MIPQSKDIPVPPTDNDIEFARRRLLTSLFADTDIGNPDACKPSSTVVAPAAAPTDTIAAQMTGARFILLGLVSGSSTDPRLWTATKVCEDTAHFLPRTREEIDALAAGCNAGELRKLAISEQIDGIVDLGQRLTNGSDGKPLDYARREYRCDTLTLDPIATVGREDNAERVKAESAIEIGLAPCLQVSRRTSQFATGHPARRRPRACQSLAPNAHHRASSGFTGPTESICQRIEHGLAKRSSHGHFLWSIFIDDPNLLI